MRNGSAGLVAAAGVAVAGGEIAPEREIGRVPELIPVSDAVALTLLAVVELVAVLAVVAIWRERGRPWSYRLIWTAVTLVPVVGLVAALVWRDPPPPRDPTERPSRNGLT